MYHFKFLIADILLFSKKLFCKSKTKRLVQKTDHMKSTLVYIGTYVFSMFLEGYAQWEVKQLLFHFQPTLSTSSLTGVNSFSFGTDSLPGRGSGRPVALFTDNHSRTTSLSTVQGPLQLEVPWQVALGLLGRSYQGTRAVVLGVAGGQSERVHGGERWAHQATDSWNRQH